MRRSLGLLAAFTTLPLACAGSGSSSTTGAEASGSVSARARTERRAEPTPQVDRPALPEAPADRYEVADGQLAFPSPDGFLLEGNLYYPRGATPAGAVVLVAGSGPQSRRGAVPGQLGMAFGFEFPVLEELAVALARRGYAVLSYDKRSCGRFNACGDNHYPEPTEAVTVQQFLMDAVAAVDALAKQPMVQNSRMVVLGHSQGATLVPHVLQSRGRLRAGVMVAAPHSSVDDLFDVQARQIRDVLRAVGGPPGVAKQLTQLGTQVRALRDDEAQEGPVAGAPSAFWRSWLELGDGAPRVAARLRRPLLVLHGGLDWNVPRAEHAAWRETLARVPTARVVLVPEVTHALNRVTSDRIRDIQPGDLGREIAPEVMDALHRFLALAMPNEPA